MTETGTPYHIITCSLANVPAIAIPSETVAKELARLRAEGVACWQWLEDELYYVAFKDGVATYLEEGFPNTRMDTNWVLGCLISESNGYPVAYIEPADPKVLVHTLLIAERSENAGTSL